MFLTIFTPTYNRAYILKNLYNSLCEQTSKDFEWLIVDDGSTDNTDDLVRSFINERKIRIRYLRQANSGKHIAINKGVSNASGKLFIIVDSDDVITRDAVEWIIQTGSLIIDRQDIAGLSGIRIDGDGIKIGGGSDFGIIEANAIDIRLKYGVVGDLAEIFKTDLLKQFPFPEFDDEKFCPEALVWFRIARKYKMRYCYKGIYICEYLPDGLTAKITKLRRNSPIASMTYYSEHFHDKIPIVWRLKAAINFWRFKLAPYKKEYDMLSPLSLACWLPGKIMQLSDSKK